MHDKRWWWWWTEIPECMGGRDGGREGMDSTDRKGTINEGRVKGLEG